MFCLHQPLIQHRMRPGRVRANEYHQIAVFHVLVAARHHVFTEGAFVAHHRRRHAQPRVGINVRRPDKAFHQLVGGIVILGQQLAGGIKRHRLRPPFVDDVPQPLARFAQRLRPCHLPAIDNRAQQASLQSRGFPEGRSFYAQTTEIRRMSFIPPNAHLFTVCAGDHAAAHPAVRARCPGFRHEASARITSSSFPTHTLPFSIFTGQARTAGAPLSA